MPKADCFSFAFACIPLQKGLSKANEKKSYLCVLCDFAVKSNNHRNIEKLYETVIMKLRTKSIKKARQNNTFSGLASGYQWI